MQITPAMQRYGRALFRFSPLVGARGADRAKVSWAQLKDE
jgi:hypothetical protein